MRYIVINNFYDRFDNMKLNIVGDEHLPPNEERANQLIIEGFIEAKEDQQKDDGKEETSETASVESDLEELIKHTGAGYYELPNGEKIRGKENAIEALKNLEIKTESDES